MNKRNWLWLILPVLLFMTVRAHTAEVKMSEIARTGDVFVVGVMPDPSSDKQILLKFDSGKFQFTGSVQNSSDVQLNDKNEIVIKPSAGTIASLYELQFMVATASDDGEFLLIDGKGERRLEICSAGSFSTIHAALLIILVLMVITAFLIKTRRTGKPISISSDSRFAEEDKNNDCAVQKVSPSEDHKPEPQKAAKNTQKNQIVSEHSQQSDEHLKNRLAALFNDEDEDDSSPKPVAAVKAPAVEVPLEVPTKREEPAGSVPPVAPPVKKNGVGLKIAIKDETLAGTSLPPVEKTNREKLVFAIEDDKGRIYEGSGEIVNIGRRKENQIAISASEISREHLEVTINRGVLLVRALTETNVTRLNDRSIKDKQPIKPGDKLDLGGIIFIVRKARPV